MKRENTGIVLNFENIQTVSSSFIDELIAKMVLDLGFIKFNSAIRMKAMNKDVKYLCERSVYMRIYDEWRAK